MVAIGLFKTNEVSLAHVYFPALEEDVVCKAVPSDCMSLKCGWT